MRSVSGTFRRVEMAVAAARSRRDKVRAHMIDVDDRHWPLVLFRFSGHVSMAELEAYLKRQDVLMARRQTMGSLVLTDNVKMWEAALLRRQADWIKTNMELLKQYSVGAALIIHSPIVRGMLKAILWLQPMPQPHLVCSHVDEALRWLRSRFLAAHVNVELPATI
jgi:hypothetical protein